MIVSRVTCQVPDRARLTERSYLPGVTESLYPSW